MGWRGGRLEAGGGEHESDEHSQYRIRPRNGAGGKRIEGLGKPAFPVLRDKSTLRVGAPGWHSG